jgi:hypothetical protein
MPCGAPLGQVLLVGKGSIRLWRCRAALPGAGQSKLLWGRVDRMETIKQCGPIDSRRAAFVPLASTYLLLLTRYLALRYYNARPVSAEAGGRKLEQRSKLPAGAVGSEPSAPRPNLDDLGKEGV